ncbi:MAG TPA: helix-turn-helix transcriptional regulator [Pseudogracilibacillus sp.]|nr:helix-turn-helix transcriptional regulator [Pseudogracilibacillus sp.]
MENNIRLLRRDANMTQEDLAKAIGVSRQSVVAIEKGRYNPSLELAFKIARQFNKQVEEVFIYEGTDK